LILFCLVLYCVVVVHSRFVPCLFFFSSRRRHTRSKRDWSSDVCSSDLPSQRRKRPPCAGHPRRVQRHDPDRLGLSAVVARLRGALAAVRPGLSGPGAPPPGPCARRALTQRHRTSALPTAWLRPCGFFAPLDKASFLLYYCIKPIIQF